LIKPGLQFGRGADWVAEKPVIILASQQEKPQQTLPQGALQRMEGTDWVTERQAPR